jgi:DNA-binding IclR family transcriptional regulator
LEGKFVIRTRGSDGAPSRDARPSYRVQAVDRAATLLRAISTASHPLTAWELARECGLNRSTAWRLLSTLEDHGLVERDAVSQRYRPGYAAVQLGSGAELDTVARRVRPILQRLADSSGEIVTLAAARRFTLVYVDQADPPGPPTPNWSGRPIPLHATSSGKVFLAWLPEEERRSLLPSTLEGFTPRTITDPVKLERALAQTRRDGFATCIGEFEEFSNGVSAGVFDRVGRPMVIVNVWGPSQRVTRQRLPGLGREALKAAHEMSLLLLE